MEFVGEVLAETLGLNTSNYQVRAAASSLNCRSSVLCIKQAKAATHSPRAQHITPKLTIRQ
jgi:hypothetical protein